MTQDEAKPRIIEEWDRLGRQGPDVAIFYIHLKDNRPDLLEFRVRSGSRYTKIKSWLVEAGRIVL